MGWVVVKDVTGTSFEERAVPEELVGSLRVKDAGEAWRALTEAPQLDRAFLGGLRDRLVEIGPDGKRTPLAAPRTIASALALASAPSVMRAAEDLVREAFARAAPFGVGPCPVISWRSAEKTADGLPGQAHARSAFSPVHAPIIDALGYGAWMGLSHPAQRMFSFARYGVDIPCTLQWAANDMGQAMQVDAARSQALVTKSGVAYAAQGNPFECLLRIAYSGILVERVTAEQVVLVVVEG
jgi:hypothetical protein